MPDSTERKVPAWIACANADAAVSGDHLKEDVEGRVSHGISVVIARFYDRDEEHGQRNPPEVMAKLVFQLFAKEVSTCALFRENMPAHYIHDRVFGRFVVVV